MNKDNKKFSYFEGYGALLNITVIILFFWNFTGGASDFFESLFPNDLWLIPLILYFIVTGLGGLFFIFLILNDVVDSLFEDKNKNNPNYKTQKTVILTVLIGALIIWFFAHFEPKQECIKNITLSGTSVYTYTNKDIKERFKSRNDALDYCMAQRWDF
jgi:hypothetical protein